MTAEDRIKKALDIAENLEGADHKQWIIDQMVRALTGCPLVQRTAKDWQGHPYTFEAQGESQEYLDWVAASEDGEDGPQTYEWDTGIAP